MILSPATVSETCSRRGLLIRPTRSTSPACVRPCQPNKLLKKGDMTMVTATATMKAVQVPQAGKPLELIEKEIPQPRPGQVRIQVHACGICHSDVMVREG